MTFEADDDNQLFPQQIGGGDEYEGAPDGGLSADDATPDDDDPSEQIAALNEKLQALEERNRATEQFYQQTVANLVSNSGGGQNQNQQQNQPAVEIPSFDDLPDPTEDPEGFRSALGERLNNTVKQTTEHYQRQVDQATQAQQQATRQEKLNSLWGRFREKYADLAKHEALAEGASTIVAREMRANGVQDVESAVLADPDGFIDKIANRVQTEIGTLTGGDAPAQRTTQNRRTNARTAGVGGGSRAGRAGGKANNNDDKGRPFIDQLKHSQLESGLI